MKVLVAARKGASDAAKTERTETETLAKEEPRVPFQNALRQATLVILALPYSPTSHNLISARELELMHPEIVIINISRGGIVDEPARACCPELSRLCSNSSMTSDTFSPLTVLTSLKAGKIHGYGSDVFVTEPAGSPADSPLLSREAQHLNLTLTPHIAWHGDLTLRNIQQACAQNIIAFFAGIETENTVL
jgi:lactate dehydrogenase-like 2-hydroxyacid dehydrogenase